VADLGFKERGDQKRKE